MGELTLLILRFAFLVLLWGFVFIIVYSLRSDLFGQKVRRMPAAAPTGAPRPAPSQSAVTDQLPSPARAAASGGSGSLDARRLVITSGSKAGMEIALPSDSLTIGRSSESSLVIRDDYTSTHHARLLLWADGWVIQDLDSTNGTFLDGTRVHVPTPVPLGTPVRIGQTSFELRR